jgi:hypothetical protein
MERFERWREVMQAAQDEAGVAQAVREYVATMPAAVVSLLPAECQKALADHDIQRSAITLMHCELGYSGDATVAELLHGIAQTYAAASQRIARLAKER